jgi:hypothetical protein
MPVGQPAQVAGHIRPEVGAVGSHPPPKQEVESIRFLAFTAKHRQRSGDVSRALFSAAIFLRMGFCRRRYPLRRVQSPSNLEGELDLSRRSRSRSQ